MFYLAEIGENIAWLRRARGISQEQAALDAGISPARWQQIERGGRNATLDTLRRMAKVLSVAPLTLGILFLSDEQILVQVRRLPPLPPSARPGTIGQNVALLRKAAGLSQKELAKRARVSAARLRDMELGCANVTVKFLARVAAGLGLPMPALGAVGLSEDQVLGMVHQAAALLEGQDGREGRRLAAVFR